MKKIFIAITIITIISVSHDLNEKKVIIPKDSIRFRVIANSNTKEDQDLKIKVKNNLEKEINKTILQTTSIDEARQKIEKNILVYKNNIEQTLQNEQSKEKYTINYGMNYFPQKEYKNVIYESGPYESLVVTLGKGTGNNFWCVLFPPLCLLDEENKSNNEIEYHFLVKDILDKYKK